MKSYFLEGLSDEDAVSAALTAELPGQKAPWILGCESDGIKAYFHLEPSAERYEVQVDISGRFADGDDRVIAVLRTLQSQFGGRITNDEDEVL